MLYSTFENHVKTVVTQSNRLSTKNDVLWRYSSSLLSSSFCLHLTKISYENLLLRCEENSRNKIWLIHISTGGNPRTPPSGPYSSKAHVNFSGNSAKSKMVKQGSVVSSEIRSVCLGLAKSYTGRPSFIVFNHLWFNIFLSSWTAKCAKCGTIAFYFMEVVNL